MAKGVSGALTRLAKVNVVTPLRGAPASGQGFTRTRPASDEDEDAIYLPEDIEDLSARQFVRKRPEPAPVPTAVVAAAAVVPVPVSESAGSLGVGPSRRASGTTNGSGNDSGSGRTASPVNSESGRRRALRAVEVAVEPEFEMAEDAPQGARRGGRIAERIRRIKTALAARSGREAEPEVASRSRGCEPGVEARSTTGRRRLLADDEEPEGTRTERASWRAKQLARVRRRLGMTQAEFARCFGLATDDVVRWEAGARPARAERVLLTLIMHDPEEMARLVDEAMPLK
ncbi:MAG: hypothetical protein WCF85_16625 [Rhodospirillaceae bacterium]